MKQLIYILLVIIGFFLSCKKQAEKKNVEIKEIKKPKPIMFFGYNLNKFNVVHDTIENGESFAVILDRHHVMYPKINKIATTIKDTFDVRRVRSGKSYTILISKDSLQKAQVFIYKHNKVQSTIIDFKDSVISAFKHKKKRSLGCEILSLLFLL